MAVLALKPHSLRVLLLKSGEEMENGDYIEGDKRWSCPIKCDAVPAGKANEKVFEDGVTRKYTFTCYLAHDCREFAIGERVRLSRNGLVQELEVKGFIRYQKQAKLWLGWG